MRAMSARVVPGALYPKSHTLLRNDNGCLPVVAAAIYVSLQIDVAAVEKPQMPTVRSFFHEFSLTESLSVDLSFLSPSYFFMPEVRHGRSPSRWNLHQVGPLSGGHHRPLGFVGGRNFRCRSGRGTPVSSLLRPSRSLEYGSSARWHVRCSKVRFREGGSHHAVAILARGPSRSV